MSANQTLDGFQIEVNDITSWLNTDKLSVKANSNPISDELLLQMLGHNSRPDVDFRVAF